MKFVYKGFMVLMACLFLLGGVNALFFDKHVYYNVFSNTSLNEMDDVNVFAPLQNQLLVYNFSLGKWINKDANTVPDVNNASFLNGQSMSYFLDRANHTGTQLSSTISDFGNVWASIDGNNDFNRFSGLHNDLNGLQGGQVGEYFHLNNSAYGFLYNQDQNGKTDSNVNFKKVGIGGGFALSDYESDLVIRYGRIRSLVDLNLTTGVGTKIGFSDGLGGSGIINKGIWQATSIADAYLNTPNVWTAIDANSFLHSDTNKHVTQASFDLNLARNMQSSNFQFNLSNNGDINAQDINASVGNFNNLGVGGIAGSLTGTIVSPTILNIQPTVDYGTAAIKLGGTTNARGNSLIELAGWGYISGEKYSARSMFGFNIATEMSGAGTARYYTPLSTTNYGYSDIRFDYLGNTYFDNNQMNTTAGASITPKTRIKITGDGNVLIYNQDGTTLATFDATNKYVGIGMTPTTNFVVGGVATPLIGVATAATGDYVSLMASATYKGAMIYTTTLRLGIGGATIAGSAGGFTETARFAGTTGLAIKTSATNPTAYLHLGAGTATASTAPLKFTAGANLTTAEAGAIEFDGNRFYATITTNGIVKRKEFPTGGITSNTGSDFNVLGKLDINGNITPDSNLDQNLGSGQLAWDTVFAQNFADLTLAWDSNKDGSALTAIKSIKSKDVMTLKGLMKEIDHNSLPDIARIQSTNYKTIYVKETIDVNEPVFDENGIIIDYNAFKRIVETPIQVPDGTFTTGRSIGGMTTVITEAIKELIEENNKMKAEIEVLKADVNFLKTKVK